MFQSLQNYEFHRKKRKNKRVRKRDKERVQLTKIMLNHLVLSEIRNRFCSKLKTEGVRYKLNFIDKSVDFMKYRAIRNLYLTVER